MLTSRTKMVGENFGAKRNVANFLGPFEYIVICFYAMLRF